MSIAVLGVAFVSCTEPEMEFIDRITTLEERVSRLEELCGEMNTNISALQTIVASIQEGDYITSVNPIELDGKVVGYTISFVKSDPITIYFGKDGKDGADGKDGKDGIDGQNGADGHTPVIGVRQDTDGVWYWTLDGDWLLDSNGKKIKAIGEDGLSPQLNIQDGYWYYSVDSGKTWTQVEGQNGSSMFRNIEITDSDVTFVTADGQTFVVKRASALSIEFDSSDLVVMATNATRNIHYTITSGLSDITIEAIGSSDIKAKVVKTDAKTGAIQVKTGATIDEYSKVLVLVSNGSQSIMRTLNFEKEAIEVEENTTREVSEAGGNIVLEFFSNVECHAVIPSESQSWISIVPPTKALTKQTIKLDIQPNDGAARSAAVLVQSEDSSLSLLYRINQSENHDYQIALERTALIAFYNAMNGDGWYDNTNWCSSAPVAGWKGVQTNSLGYVTGLELGDNNLTGNISNELAPLKFLDYCYLGNNNILSISLSGMNSLRFIHISDSPITSLSISDSPRFSGLYANNCRSLKAIDLPKEQIEEVLLEYTGLDSFELSDYPNIVWFDYDGNNMATIDTRNNPKLKTIYCNQCNVESINLSGSPLIENLSLRDNKLQSIDISNLTSLSNLNLLDNNDLHNIIGINSCCKLKQLYIGKWPIGISNEVFSIDLTCFHELEGADLTGLNMESIDVSKCPNLLRLYAGGNAFAALDVSKNLQLEHLTISSNNNITSIDLSKNTELTQFECMYNGSITALDLSCNTKLQNLYVVGSGLSEIDLSDNMMLKEANLSQNQHLDFIIVSSSQTFTCNKDEHTEFFIKDNGSAPYKSVDYSRDGVVVELQRATQGAGINVVIIGDAYSDRMIEDGTYRSVMEASMGALFRYEPFKSFQPFFNVYAVEAVSKNEIISSFTATALEYAYDDRSYPYGSVEKAIYYAEKALSEDDIDNSIIITVANTTTNNGLTQLFYPEEISSSWGSGLGVVFMGVCEDLDMFEKVLTHEVGHAFAKLGDEYWYNSPGSLLVDGPATENDISQLQEYSSMGWYNNIDYVEDKNNCKWSYYVNSALYPEVDYYEGASRHTDFYRPTWNSIMRNHDSNDGFNAPSREAIYTRIHKLAYGDSWTFDRDDFLDYDSINRTSLSQQNIVRKQQLKQEGTVYHHSPVIMKNNWRETVKGN